MSKIGAVYCVYEDSGFLTESIQRIYPLMDKILILVGFAPWNGKATHSISLKTHETILKIPEPNNKIEVLSKRWLTEHE